MAIFKLVAWICSFLSQSYFEFEWDSGNEEKSLQKHGISNEEAEETFLDKELLILGLQVSPKTVEQRYGVLGKTLSSKILFVCFTIRNHKIRIISVRKANSRERKIYES